MSSECSVNLLLFRWCSQGHIHSLIDDCASADVASPVNGFFCPPAFCSLALSISHLLTHHIFSQLFSPSVICITNSHHSQGVFIALGKSDNHTDKILDIWNLLLIWQIFRINAVPPDNWVEAMHQLFLNLSMKFFSQSFSWLHLEKIREGMTEGFKWERRGH